LRRREHSFENQALSTDGSTVAIGSNRVFPLSRLERAVRRPCLLASLMAAWLACSHGGWRPNPEPSPQPNANSNSNSNSNSNPSAAASSRTGVARAARAGPPGSTQARHPDLLASRTGRIRHPHLQATPTGPAGISSFPSLFQSSSGRVRSGLAFAYR
jgi:hypothetical protein